MALKDFNSNPLINSLRTGQEDDALYSYVNIIYKVINQKVMLNELPSINYRVQVFNPSSPSTVYYEVTNVAPNTHQFVVDYTTGICSFSLSDEGKSLSFSFSGRGATYHPAERIYTIQENGKVTETLGDIIQSGRDWLNNVNTLNTLVDTTTTVKNDLNALKNSYTYDPSPYSNTKQYYVNNQVTYNGQTYICVLNSLGHLPTDVNSIYWRTFAAGKDSLRRSKRWTALSGQTDFDISDIGRYAIGSNKLEVFVSGVAQINGVQFTEVSPTLFRFNSAITVGSIVYARWFDGDIGTASGHNAQHRAGGGDEINVKDLAGYTDILPTTNWINVVNKYNVSNTGSQDVTLLVQQAINDLTQGTLYFPDGYYAISGTVTLKAKVNIVCGNNTIFRPFGTSDNFTMFEFPTYQVRNDKTVYDNFKIDGGNRNVIGMKVNNVVNLYAYDMTISNCLNTGLELSQSQFNQFYNLILFNNTLGLYVNNGNSSSGGGNSNSFYSATFASNSVGALLGERVSSNYFFAPTNLSNKVCSFAFFNNPSTNYIIGGCPEYSATGTATEIILKGKTIPRCTLYSSNATVCVENWTNNEAQASPSIVLANNSYLDYLNPRGYGQPYANHVQCDETSGVSLLGKFDAVGNFENIMASPQALTLRGRNAFTMKDLTKYDVSSKNHAIKPSTPLVSGANGVGLTISTVIDAEYGDVTSVKFASTIVPATAKGTIFSQNAFTNGVSKPFTAAAISMKSDVDTKIEFRLGEPTSCNMVVNLQAGKWKRVCLLANNVSSYHLFVVAVDQTAAGAEILMTKLMTVNADNEGYLLKLLQGYYNDNLTTETQFVATVNGYYTLATQLQKSYGNVLYGTATIEVSSNAGYAVFDVLFKNATILTTSNVIKSSTSIVNEMRATADGGTNIKLDINLTNASTNPTTVRVKFNKYGLYTPVTAPVVGATALTTTITASV